MQGKGKSLFPFVAIDQHLEQGEVTAPCFKEQCNSCPTGGGGGGVSVCVCVCVCVCV